MNTLFLVTGATGHLGNTIIRKLLADGHRVRALVLRNDGLLDTLPSGLEVCFGDVSDMGTLAPFFASEGGEMIVIHCAGIVSITSGMQEKIHDINVNGTRNIVDMCVASHVSKLVYVSSVHALPVLPAGVTMTEVGAFSPDRVRGVYAKTKAEATAIVLASADRLNVTVVHPSGIIGPFDSGKSPMTELFINLGCRKLPACVTGGYDFVDVRDVADGIISCCCSSGKSGECYILSGRYIPVSEIVGTIGEMVGVSAPVTLPIWLAKAAAPLFEFYAGLCKKTALFTSYSLYTLSCNSLFSHFKAEKELGFKPRPFRETVADTVAWLRQQGRLKTNGA